MGSGRPSRRSLLGLLASASAFVALPAGAQAPAPGPQKSFGYDDVVARARASWASGPSTRTRRRSPPNSRG